MASSSDATSKSTPPSAKDAALTAKRLKLRKRAMEILAAVFLVIAIIWGLYWLFIGRFQAYTDDAYVNGNLVQLMSQVPGTVVTINTDDTYLVEQGQVLIQLDPADYQVAYEQAEAELADTVRQVRQAYENAERAQQTLLLRHADLVKAELDVKRRIGLLHERAISREEVQHYDTTQAVTRAQYQAALFDLRAALALVENVHLYTHPRVMRARAHFKQAYLNLQRTTILAPVTGYVAKRSVQVGQEVGLHTPMLAILPLKEVWIDANYKETQLSDIRAGQPVSLYADAYPSVTYHGRVQGLNVGTGAAFALLPAQNATGNWIKIVQRLPVRVALLAEEIKKNPLQIGLSMHVTTDIHNTKGSRLAGIAKQQPLYATNIYADQLKTAEARINTLLQENAPNLFIPPSLSLLGKSA